MGVGRGAESRYVTLLRSYPYYILQFDPDVNIIIKILQFDPDVNIIMFIF